MHTHCTAGKQQSFCIGLLSLSARKGTRGVSSDKPLSFSQGKEHKWKFARLLWKYRLQRGCYYNPIQPKNVISSLRRLVGAAIHVSAPSQSPISRQRRFLDWKSNTGFIVGNQMEPSACAESCGNQSLPAAPCYLAPATRLLKGRNTTLVWIKTPSQGPGSLASRSEAPRLSPRCITDQAEPSPCLQTC